MAHRTTLRRYDPSEVPYTFTGTLERARRGGAMVALPPEMVVVLGGTRVRVTGTFGGVGFAGSTMPTGDGGAVLGIHKATRERARVGFGQRVAIAVEPADRERPIPIPAALRQALDADPQARQAFERLPPSHRREHARRVAEARHAETAVRRVERTLRRLRDTGDS